MPARRKPKSVQPWDRPCFHGGFGKDLCAMDHLLPMNGSCFSQFLVSNDALYFSPPPPFRPSLPASRSVRGRNPPGPTPADRSSRCSASRSSLVAYQRPPGQTDQWDQLRRLSRCGPSWILLQPVACESRSASRRPNGTCSASFINYLLSWTHKLASFSPAHQVMMAPIMMRLQCPANPVPATVLAGGVFDFFPDFRGEKLTHRTRERLRTLGSPLCPFGRCPRGGSRSLCSHGTVLVSMGVLGKTAP